VNAVLQEVEKANRVRSSESRVGIYENIRIKVSDIAAAESIMRKLEDEEGLMLSQSLADIRDGIQETQRATQMLLGGIGAISLLIAAIGIANTMFMSIYERTKEIGVMTVLGCPLSGIQSMFLFEASIIGFCGGIFGSALSVAASVVMNEVEFIQTAIRNMGGTDMYMGWGMQIEQGDISVVPAWLILAAILFSTLVGLVSGYLPSRRATKISALEAIRNE
jgi:ABC-type antimicrobial peptide transport system permease subunit